MTSDQAIKTLKMASQAMGYNEGKKIGHANGMLKAIEMLSDFRRDTKGLTEPQKKRLFEIQNKIHEQFEKDHPEYQ
jgi:hypothetical protein